MKRTLATLAAMAAGIMMATGFAEAQTRIPAGATASPGVLALAADFAAAPNQFIRPDGTRDGLNVDMCGALAEKLGAKLEWTNLAFPGLVPGLQAKRFDGLCTAIFINPDRLRIMNMVPYVAWGEGLMVPANATLGACKPTMGDAASYVPCFDELSGKTVAVAAGGTTNNNLKAQSDRLVAAGKAAITIRAFDTNADAIQAVASRQADAGYLNDPQGAFFANRTPGYKIAWAGFASNQLALATLKENPGLADAFVAGLEAMKADGSYQKILEKWGVAAVPSFAYQK
jgi:polar amino acid transport system substrate-binding protein